MSVVNGKMCQSVIRVGEAISRNPSDKVMEASKTSVDALYWLLDDGIKMGEAKPSELAHHLANVLATCHALQKVYSVSDKEVEAAANDILCHGSTDGTAKEPPMDVCKVTHTPATHNVLCYQVFSHTWILENKGNVTWSGRILRFTKIFNLQPECEDVKLPEVRPGESCRVSTYIDARGGEGDFVMQFDMRDKNGMKCLKDQPDIFNVPVTVKFLKED